MTPEDIEQRFAAIEHRLARIEAYLSNRPVPPATATPAPAAPSPSTEPTPSQEGRPSLVTSVLGWGGAIALVLAAAYLIRLAIDSGWLTPMRQVAFAAMAGLAMIGAGFLLRGVNRQYAGLLPAGGVAILFLSVYGAHLYYGFIGPKPAATAVTLVCLLSLWLCRAFVSDLYALFAVAGSYSAPFLLSRFGGSMTDLVIYFSAWSVLFSLYAIWQQRRLIYLLALYLGLIGFDAVWHIRAPLEWVPALLFQTVQFGVFGSAVVVFSIRHRAPLDHGTALAHLPPLLLFYFVQYALLKEHLPALAPWVALASTLFVAALYSIARATLKRPLPGGELLLACYVALVLFHAGYVEAVPEPWAPWMAFVLVPVVAAASLRPGQGSGTRWPIWLAVGVIFALNYLRVVFDTEIEQVPGRKALAVLYALQLYAGYYLCRSRNALQRVVPLLLYLGHVSAMAAALHVLTEPIIQSTAWGLLALACLGLSLRQRDRLLGQSSLLIFGATAVKVLLFDLSGAPPLARIFSLVVLGITFYVGGLLYQRIQHENGAS
jgi:uncharacterized membrane protein